MASAVHSDPYYLPSTLPLANAPFLSSLLFADVANRVQRSFVKVTLVDAEAVSTKYQPGDTRGSSTANLFSKGIVPPAVPTVASSQGGETEPSWATAQNVSSHNEILAADSTALPSAIEHHASKEEVDAVGRRDDDAIVEDSLHPRARGESVPFHVLVQELDARLEEQLEIHHQLNAALSSLDTVGREVRNCKSDELLARAMRKASDAPGAAAAAHTAHLHLPQRDDGGRPLALTRSPAAATVSVSRAAVGSFPTTVSPLASAAQSGAAVPPHDARAAQVARVPQASAIGRPATGVAIVRADAEPEVYTRRVLRPKAAVVPPPADGTGESVPQKTVQIASEHTVTHFDRNSPAVSAARASSLEAPWKNAASAPPRETSPMRISSSAERSPQLLRESSVGTGTVYDSLARTSSSMSAVRVSYVDRNLATLRRVGSAASSFDDIPTVMSASSDEDSDGSGRSTPPPPAELGSSSRRSSTFSMPLSRTASTVYDATGTGHTIPKPKELFEMFHRLCLKATEVLGGEADSAPPLPPADARAPRGAHAVDKEDARDVLRLQEFIGVLAKDVRRLETLRRARKERARLLERAKRVAQIRERMRRNKQASLAEVEDEVGFHLDDTTTLKRSRRGMGGRFGAENDDDDDDVIDDVASMEFSAVVPEMDNFSDVDEVVTVGSSDGGIGHGIEEDMDGDHMDDDGELMRNDDLLESSVELLDEEEDLAQYLVEHDVDHMSTNVPPHLRLIRYGVAKRPKNLSQREAEEAEERAAAEAAAALRNKDRWRQHGGVIGDEHSASSASSFISSVEDEAELAEAEERLRRRGMTQSPPATQFTTTTIVEEEEGLARLRNEVESTTASTGRSSSITTDVEVVPDPVRLARRRTVVREDSGSAEGAQVRRLPSRKMSIAPRRVGEGTVTSSRRKSTAVAAPTVESDESFARSNASSNDADAPSIPPYSTPYTSDDTIDSQSVADAATKAVELSKMVERKCGGPSDFRQRWMATERSRKKALRSILPLKTFSEMFDPCESTPSGGSSTYSSSDSRSHGHRRASSRESSAAAAAAAGAPHMLSADALACSASETSIVVSPASMAATPAVERTGMPAPSAAVEIRHGLELRLPATQLQSITMATPPRYTRASGESSGSESGDDRNRASRSTETRAASDHRSERASPPRLDATPPPPQVRQSSRSRDADIGGTPTPEVSVEMDGRSVNLGCGDQPHRRLFPASTVAASAGSLQAEMDNVNTNDALDTVRSVNTPVAAGLGQESASSHLAYPVEDVIAAREWKSRQQALIQSLRGGEGRESVLDSADAVNFSSRGKELEEDLANESAIHWAFVDLLMKRFSGTPTSVREAWSDDDSHSSLSTVTSSTSSRYTSEEGWRSDEDDDDDDDESGVQGD